MSMQAEIQCIPSFFSCVDCYIATVGLIMVPMVRESQGKSKYQGAKVNRNAEKKFELLYANVYNGWKFFLLAYFYVHFRICSSALVSSVIASD